MKYYRYMIEESTEKDGTDGPLWSVLAQGVGFPSTVGATLRAVGDQIDPKSPSIFEQALKESLEANLPKPKTYRAGE
jgi:hypothetical protein